MDIQRFVDVFSPPSQYQHLDFQQNNTLGGTYCSFPCVDCGKVYKYKQSLTLHRRVFCGKEPKIQCPYCPKRCYRSRDYYAHVRQSHQEKVFELNQNVPPQQSVQRCD